MSDENSRKQMIFHKQMWFQFYIEPYNKETKIKEYLKKYLNEDVSSIDKQFQKKQIQPKYFDIILPFMLLCDKFLQNYLNISLSHCQTLSNAQNLIHTAITQLDILSYKDDTFYRRFIELAKIDRDIRQVGTDAISVRASLQNIASLEFKNFDKIKEYFKDDIDKIEQVKILMEAKYKASWHITNIRLISYERDSRNTEQERYNEICEHVENAVKELLKDNLKWDYDCAMLYVALQGYKFLGTREPFLEISPEQQKKWQQAFKDLKHTVSNSNSYREDIATQLQPYIYHPHIRCYIEYYEFLYIQRKMQIAAKMKNLKKFTKSPTTS